MRLETRFPESDVVRLHLSCAGPVEVGLKIRWPGWVRSGFAVSVNGQPQEVEGQPGCYVTVRRTWQDGDRVEVRVPMSLHVEPLPGAEDIVAVLYGPLVLAGELGREGLETVSPYARQQLEHLRVPTPRVPVWVGDLEKLVEHVERVEGRGLAFRTRGLGRPADVTLIPFHALHHQRYTVYWELFTEGAGKPIRRGWPMPSGRCASGPGRSWTT
ncbi:MAG: glycoside hydrolase family 127 protein [Verrucomicrobia bacterium]|nr:glycoside hydrolase family 127 protein [Verrucomicrobiota bacterium]